MYHQAGPGLQHFIVGYKKICYTTKGITLSKASTCGCRPQGHIFIWIRNDRRAPEVKGVVPRSSIICKPLQTISQKSLHCTGSLEMG